MTPAEQQALIQTAVLAADFEMTSNFPVSRIPNPDGSPQGETKAEQTRRIVETAVLHLIETGLLTVPHDLGERLEQPIPIQRGAPAWPS